MAYIYAKTIQPTNQQPACCTPSQPQTLTTSLVELSLNTQANSVYESQPLCVIINDNATNQPREALTRAIRRTNFNNSSITTNRENEPTCNLMSDPPSIINFCPIEAPRHPPPPKTQTRELLHSCLPPPLPHTPHWIQINIGSMRVVSITHQCRHTLEIEHYLSNEHRTHQTMPSMRGQTNHRSQHCSL
jgi:hypothetical protein